MEKEKLLSILLSLYFVLVVVTDFYYKYSVVNNIDLFRYSFLLKLIIGISLVSFSCFSLKLVDYKKTCVIFFLLVLCSIISIINIDERVRYSVLYIQGQYFFGIIVSFFFFKFYKKIVYKYLETTLEVILWINLVLIVVGSFYGTPLFKTYIHGTRFGYSGLFKSTSVATYFYMFGFILFFLKRKSKYNYLLLLNVIMALLFIGSKSSYLFLFLVTLFLIGKAILNTNRIKKLKLFFGFFVTISIVIAVVIFKVIISLNPVLKEVFETHGVVTAFFSYRDHLVTDVLLIVKEKYKLMNYLFGGIEHVPRLTEVAIIDLLITFGVVGGGLFGYIFVHNFPKIKKLEMKFMLCIIGLIIMLRGDFFYFPSVVYMALAIFALIVKAEEPNKMNLKMI